MDKTPAGTGEFEKIIQIIPGSEPWFNGVVNSIFYKPNEFVLVNDCQPEYSPFSLLYPSMYSTTTMDIYDSLICEIEFKKDGLWAPKNQDFCMGDEEPYPSVNKRLASYVTCSKKWPFPKRNNFIHVSIDYSKLFDIDLNEFWIECFNKFKN